MENKKDSGKPVFKPGYILDHTDLQGERNPLPKLPEGLKWRGYQRRGDKNNEFISYIVYDPNVPPPKIDELPPMGVEGPLYKSKEEALKENPPAQPTLPTIDSVRPRGEDETL